MCVQEKLLPTMRTDCGLSTTSRVSCSSNRIVFDFVPKSDYNEKGHLDNKCLFHNQQFLEGDTCRFGKNRGKIHVPCEFCDLLDNKFKGTTDENPLIKKSHDFCEHLDDKLKATKERDSLNRRSGDWNHKEEMIEHSSETVIQKPSISDWKSKNVYSVLNCNRRNRNNFTLEKNFSSSSSRDECNKVDSRYEDRARGKSFLHNFREYLVNYQESCGVPRTEYSFSALIQIMGQATGRSLLALLYVMLNIVPLVEVLLYVLRFVLDKVINIRSSKDFRQMLLRCFVFTIELLSVYICLIFIFGFIVLPILQMVIGVVARIVLYN